MSTSRRILNKVIDLQPFRLDWYLIMNQPIRQINEKNEKLKD